MTVTAITSAVSVDAEELSDDPIYAEVDGSEVNISLEMVSPARAQYLLTMNTNNRKANKDRIAQLSRHLRNNEFRFNGDSVRISSEGVILDGQHRLYAIVDSGVSAPLLIVDGLRPDALQTIDQGRPRTATDISVLRGVRIKNHTTAMGISRHMILFGDLPGKQGLSKDRQYVALHLERNQSAMELAATEAKNLVNLARKIGLTTRPSLRGGGHAVVSNTVLGTLIYTMIENGADTERVVEFFRRIIEGLPPSDEYRDLFFAARNRLVATAPLISRQNTADEIIPNFEVFIRAYNAWRMGRNISRLQEPKNLPKTLGELTKPLTD